LRELSDEYYRKLIARYLDDCDQIADIIESHADAAQRIAPLFRDGQPYIGDNNFRPIIELDSWRYVLDPQYQNVEEIHVQVFDAHTFQYQKYIIFARGEQAKHHKPQQVKRSRRDAANKIRETTAWWRSKPADYIYTETHTNVLPFWTYSAADIIHMIETLCDEIAAIAHDNSMTDSAKITLYTDRLRVIEKAAEKALPFIGLKSPVTYANQLRWNDAPRCRAIPEFVAANVQLFKAIIDLIREQRTRLASAATKSNKVQSLYARIALDLTDAKVRDEVAPLLWKLKDATAKANELCALEFENEIIDPLVARIIFRYPNTDHETVLDVGTVEDWGKRRGVIIQRAEEQIEILVRNSNPAVMIDVPSGSDASTTVECRPKQWKDIAFRVNNERVLQIQEPNKKWRDVSVTELGFPKAKKGKASPQSDLFLTLIWKQGEIPYEHRKKDLMKRLNKTLQKYFEGIHGEPVAKSGKIWKSNFHVAELPKARTVRLNMAELGDADNDADDVKSYFDEYALNEYRQNLTD